MGELYDCIHHTISALWTFPRVPVNLFYGNRKADTWGIQFFAYLNKELLK